MRFNDTVFASTEFDDKASYLDYAPGRESQQVRTCVYCEINEKQSPPEPKMRTFLRIFGDRRD